MAEPPVGDSGMLFSCVGNGGGGKVTSARGWKACMGGRWGGVAMMDAVTSQVREKEVAVGGVVGPEVSMCGTAGRQAGVVVTGCQDVQRM